MSKSVNLSKNKREDSVARKSTKDALSLDAIEVDSKAGSFSMNTTGKVISSKKPSGTGKSSGGSSGWNFTGLAFGNIACDNYTVDTCIFGLNVDIKNLTKDSFYEISLVPTTSNTLSDLGDVIDKRAKAENDEYLTDAEKEDGKINYGVFITEEEYFLVPEIKPIKCSMCGAQAISIVADSILEFDITLKLPQWKEQNQASNNIIDHINDWLNKLTNHEKHHQKDYDTSVIKAIKVYSVKVECCSKANLTEYNKYCSNFANTEIGVFIDNEKDLFLELLDRCLKKNIKLGDEYHSTYEPLIEPIHGSTNLK